MGRQCLNGLLPNTDPALIKRFSVLADTGVIEQVIRAGGQTRKIPILSGITPTFNHFVQCAQRFYAT